MKILNTKRILQIIAFAVVCLSPSVAHGATTSSSEINLNSFNPGSVSISASSAIENTEIISFEYAEPVCDTSGELSIELNILDRVDTVSSTLNLNSVSNSFLLSEECLIRDGVTENTVSVNSSEFAELSTSLSFTLEALETNAVNLHLETYDQVLYSGEFTYTECPIAEGQTTYSLSTWCAIDQLGIQEGWTLEGSNYDGQVFLSKINGYDGADWNWWAFFHNLEFASEALNEYIPAYGEDILLSYGIMPMKIEVSDLSPAFGAETTITAYEFGFDPTTYSPVWLESSSSTVTINGIGYDSADGTYILTTGSSTTYIASTSKAGFIASSEISITPALPTAITNIQIETYDTTLFNGSFEFTACEAVEDSGEYALSAWCAIKQLGAQEDWTVEGSNYDGQVFLSKINGYDGTDWNWWAFFHNLDFASEALNEYIPSETDQILLTYGTMPLRIESSSANQEVGTNVNLTVLEFGFDPATFSPVWSAAASSSVTVNSEVVTTTDGVYSLEITTTTTYTISGTKTGFVDSAETTVTGIEPIVEEEEDDTTPPSSPPASPPASGGDPDPNTNTYDQFQSAIYSAIQFLIANQDQDGGFGSEMFSDWVAIAYGDITEDYSGLQTSKDSLKTYLSAQEIDQITTGIERQILARTALGLETNGFQTTLVPILEQGLLEDNLAANEVIFGILSLDSLNCCSELILELTSYMETNLEVENFVSGLDLRAATIRALLVTKNSSDEQVVSLRSELKESLQTDGSINNNIDTTSWALDALFELGETDLSDWSINSTNPLKYLLDSQSSDGSFGTSNQVWSTSYALQVISASWDASALVVETVVNDSPAPPPAAPKKEVKKTISLIDLLTVKVPEIEIIEEKETLNEIIETEEMLEDQPVKEEKSHEVNPQTSTDTSPRQTATNPVVEIPVTAVAEEQVEEKELEKQVLAEPLSDDKPEEPVDEENQKEAVLVGDQEISSEGPLQKTARKVFGSALAASLAAGAFLGWRLLKTLV